jgi:hypothetical protein
VSDIRQNWQSILFKDKGEAIPKLQFLEQLPLKTAAL